MKIFTEKMNYRQFIHYIFPSILTMIFLSFYTTIDGYFISKYVGSDALAGINIVIPITCVIFGTSVMFATGSGAIIGELMGQNKQQAANQIFSAISLVLVLFALGFTLIGILYLKPIASLLGASERLMPHVLPYELVIFMGTLPMAFKLYFEYMVRTDGNAKVGLKMSIVGLILNTLLDYLFVGVFDFKTLGAALGTVISISISALIGLNYFLKDSKIRFVKPQISFNDLIKSMTNGSSEMLTELSTGITTLLFNLIIMEKLGEDGLAAVTIIMYIYYFFIAFYMGIAVASSPVISYNLGAANKAKIKEITRYSLITIGITACAIILIIFFFGDLIIGLFSKPGHVFDLTQNALFYFSPVFIFIGVNVFMSGYFTAVGDGFTSALISALRSFVFVVILIVTLPQIIGINGIWMSMPIAEILTIIIALALFKTKGRPYYLS